MLVAFQAFIYNLIYSNCLKSGSTGKLIVLGREPTNLPIFLPNSSVNHRPESLRQVRPNFNSETTRREILLPNAISLLLSLQRNIVRLVETDVNLSMNGSNGWRTRYLRKVIVWQLQYRMQLQTSILVDIQVAIKSKYKCIRRRHLSDYHEGK